MIRMLLDLVIVLRPKMPRKKLADVTWDKFKFGGNSIIKASLGKMGLEGRREKEYMASFCTYELLLVTSTVIKFGFTFTIPTKH
jgi:hypothetical protein